LVKQEVLPMRDSPSPMKARMLDALSPPLWGRVGEGGNSRGGARGSSPSLTLPHCKSGLPDLRKFRMSNRGKPRLRGGGNESVT
jgi:hypothetical protein